MRLKATCGFFCLLSLSLPACSRDGANSESSPEALRILSEASEFYRSQPGIRFAGHLEAVVHHSDGDRIDGLRPLVEDRTIALLPSNRYMLEGSEHRLASNGTSIYFNRMLPTKIEGPQAADLLNLQPAGGTSAAVGSAASDIYFRDDPAPQTLELARLPVASLFGGPPNLLILSLLEPGLSELAAGDNSVLIEHPPVTISGQRAQHLEIRWQPSQDGDPPEAASATELWIAAEGDPLLLQVRNRSQPRTMKYEGHPIDVVVVTTETFTGWRFGADLPESLFGPVPGSRRVASIGQLLQPPSPLLGQPAPDVELPLADGSTTSLSALTGDGKIVLLDFWATWCRPCLMELPAIAKLAEELADDGVVLYAVNQGQSLDEVKSFQSSQTYQFNAALDETGEISDAFAVGAIPHLCIVGRDGTVQVVHVGVGADTEQSIRTELAALMAGRNLAVDGLPD